MSEKQLASFLLHLSRPPLHPSPRPEDKIDMIWFHALHDLRRYTVPYHQAGGEKPRATLRLPEAGRAKRAKAGTLPKGAEGSPWP